MDDEMSKELINRIRAKKRNATDEEDESADLIESQAAQIEMLRDALKWARSSLNKGACGTIIQRDFEEAFDLTDAALSTTTNEALQAFAEKDRCKQRLSGFKNLIGDRRSIRSATACNRE